jgi:hypothetical protein
LKLRFTGEWPPPGLWKQYPNWESALEEEGEPGQDETTLRPSEEQRFVISFGFTAGEVEQANGQRLPALLSVCDEIDGVTAFTSETGGWSIQRLGRPARWVCTVEDWRPEAERAPSVSLEDPSVFPLRVRSLLPVRETGKLLEFTIRADGSIVAG